MQRKAADDEIQRMIWQEQVFGPVESSEKTAKQRR
jgi:hypothetical protein